MDLFESLRENVSEECYREIVTLTEDIMRYARKKYEEAFQKAKEATPTEKDEAIKKVEKASELNRRAINTFLRRPTRFDTPKAEQHQEDAEIKQVYAKYKDPKAELKRRREQREQDALLGYPKAIQKSQERASK